VDIWSDNIKYLIMQHLSIPVVARLKELNCNIQDGYVYTVTQCKFTLLK